MPSHQPLRRRILRYRPMSIFPRRIVQGLIDASPRYLRTSLIRNLVNRLNGLADPNDALAAEWDVVVLRFVSGFTTVPARLAAGRCSLGLRRTILSFAISRRSVLQHRGLPCALVLPLVVRCLRTGLTLRHVTPAWVLQGAGKYRRRTCRKQSRSAIRAPSGAGTALYSAG